MHLLRQILREMREDILRRLLVAKHLLARNSGQLTPNSDATAVAEAVLAAHDGAELAIAALASHLNVPGLGDKITLVDYPSKIESHTGSALPGADFLRQLNSARVGFKHHGNLPDARAWYRVIDRTWDWMDEWCKTYLGVSIDAIDLDELLADPEVKGFYEAAKQLHREGRFGEALEGLARGLFLVLRAFRGIELPSVGHKSTEQALMLSAFGVRPSDFLALQSFLPYVKLDRELRTMGVEWDSRATGHAGNWTDANVRFCLEIFLDLALKVQHAPDAPQALRFSWVFDDVVTPKGESATLFQYDFDGPPWLQRVKGRRTVRVLHRGERLRCSAAPAEDYEKKQATPLDVAAAFAPKPTVDTAEVLLLWIEGGEPQVLYVYRNEVVLGVAPKDEEWVRAACPHLYPAEDHPKA